MTDSISDGNNNLFSFKSILFFLNKLFFTFQVLSWQTIKYAIAYNNIQLNTLIKCLNWLYTIDKKR